jgi:hypothetical protein
VSAKRGTDQFGGFLVEWGNEAVNRVKIKIEIVAWILAWIYLVNFAIINQSGASPEAFRTLC